MAAPKTAPAPRATKRPAAKKPATAKSKPAAKKPAAPRKKTTTARQPAAKKVGVVPALETELAELRKRDQALADGALAATALSLARDIDSTKTSATAKGGLARALDEILARIRELAPPPEAADGVTRIADQRAARRRSSAA